MQDEDPFVSRIFKKNEEKVSARKKIEMLMLP